MVGDLGESLWLREIIGSVYGEKETLVSYYIRKHSLPHRLCLYPCLYSDYQSSSYYDSMDLSDISKFKDLMTTSSDEDIPALYDIGY